MLPVPSSILQLSRSSSILRIYWAEHISYSYPKYEYIDASCVYEIIPRIPEFYAYARTIAPGQLEPLPFGKNKEVHSSLCRREY